MTIMEKETKIRELWISKEEFQALEKCNSETRYTYTVKRIIDTEVLWTIVDEEDHLVIQTDGNKKLLPVWSSKEYAQVFCVKGENNYKYSPITSETFQYSVIDYIKQNGILINVFPTKKEPLGKIVDLKTFVEEINYLAEDCYGEIDYFTL